MGERDSTSPRAARFSGSVAWALCMLVAGLGVFVSPAIAQSWSARSELGFVAARGNSSTQTANAKLEFMRQGDRWKNLFAASGLYGKSSSVQTAQRLDMRYQLDNQFSEKVFWFTSLRYEDDRYSGFDFQGTASLGFGRKLIETDATKLSAQIGAGYRVLRRQVLVRDLDTDEVIARLKGDRDADLVGNAAITFEHAFNDHTKVLDAFLVETGEANTLSRNDLALEVKMIQTLAISLGVSFRHNSVPQNGLKRTDTLTTVNLVYLKGSTP